jgi:hypothetical protein
MSTTKTGSRKYVMLCLRIDLSSGFMEYQSNLHLLEILYWLLVNLMKGGTCNLDVSWLLVKDKIGKDRYCSNSITPNAGMSS